MQKIAAGPDWFGSRRSAIGDVRKAWTRLRLGSLLRVCEWENARDRARSA
jgi:hypothetical protein